MSGSYDIRDSRGRKIGSIEPKTGPAETIIGLGFFVVVAIVVAPLVAVAYLIHLLHQIPGLSSVMDWLVTDGIFVPVALIGTVISVCIANSTFGNRVTTPKLLRRYALWYTMGMLGAGALAYAIGWQRWYSVGAEFVGWVVANYFVVQEAVPS
jgi:hypothetical protein